MKVIRKQWMQAVTVCVCVLALLFRLYRLSKLLQLVDHIAVILIHSFDKVNLIHEIRQIFRCKDHAKKRLAAILINSRESRPERSYG